MIHKLRKKKRLLGEDIVNKVNELIDEIKDLRKQIGKLVPHRDIIRHKPDTK